MAKTERATPPAAQIVPTRKCASYDPSGFMREFTYENGVRELYLEVKYRVDWFLHWCDDHGVAGFIDESDVQIIPEMGMVMARCTITLDGQVAAKSVAARALPIGDVTSANIAVQTACTCAKGRALANMGFGTVNGNSSENGEIVPPESGIVLPKAPQNSMDSMNPLEALTARQEPSTTPSTTPKRGRPRKAAVVAADMVDKAEATQQLAAPQPAPEPASIFEGKAAGSSVAVNDGSIPATVEEARVYICPVGARKGKTMGEIWVTSPESVRFYGSEKFQSGPRYPGLVAAARLLMNTVN